MATILIVDDMIENVRLLKHALQPLGHIVFARTGAEALQQAAAHTPQIILLDVVMPGLDGYATCRQLKADPTTAHIPVIFITGSDAAEDEEQGLAAGAIDYVTKPFVPAVVRARVRNHLALVEAHAELRAANDALRKFKAAVDCSPAGIMFTDRNARIEFINPAFAAASGYSMAEAIGQTPALLRSPTTPAERVDELWQTITSNRVWRGELCNLRRDGKPAWEDVAIGPVFDDAGQPTHYVAVYSDITRRREMEEELRRLAVSDPLTGLANRRQLMVMGEQEFHRAARSGAPLAALMLDIDHFKRINDRLGHPCGDAAIRGLGQIAQPLIRNIDLLARIGGEEFTVLLPGTDLAGAGELAERLRSHIADASFTGPQGETIQFTVSIGCAERDAAMKDFASLLSLADQALYRAKQNGRNRVELG